jgi:hypothetical protein
LKIKKNKNKKFRKDIQFLMRDIFGIFWAKGGLGNSIPNSFPIVPSLPCIQGICKKKKSQKTTRSRYPIDFPLRMLQFYTM